jgi:hypothetical protein
MQESPYWKPDKRLSDPRNFTPFLESRVSPLLNTATHECLSTKIEFDLTSKAAIKFIQYAISNLTEVCVVKQRS